MVSNQEMVRAFMEKHNFPVDLWQMMEGAQTEEARIKAREEWHRCWLKRIAHMQEELCELANAAAREDIVEVADAIADLYYMTYGAALLAGIDLEPVFNEVHSSNMTKVPGTGKFKDGYKPKGPGYRAPDIKMVLEAQGIVVK